MTNNFREIHLGSEALEYIRASLAQGKTLASYLLQRPDLENGHVLTFLPPQVSEEQVKEFTFGGKLPTPPAETHTFFTAKDGSRYKAIPIPNTDFWLVAAVEDFLKAGEGAICCFEDALAKPGDPWLSALDTPVWVFQDEVYHFLVYTDPKGRKIESVIRRAKSIFPPLIGAFTFVTKKIEAVVDARGLGSTELKTLAENAEKIVVGAYDGEGYLIWCSPTAKLGAD